MGKMRRKIWILLAAGIGVMALIFLAAGLSSVDLVNQTNYALPTQQVEETFLVTPAPDMSDFLAKLGIIFSILVPLSILYVILSPEARKRFLNTMIPLSLLLLGMWYLTRNIQNNNARVGLSLDLQGTQDALGEQRPASTLLQPFSPNESPKWLVFMISLVIVVVIALAFFWFWKMARARRQYHPIQQLVHSAQDALEELRAGVDLRDVILRCYQEMNAVVSEKRAIVRPHYLTPRAFTRKLETVGLPADQVQRLTRLFEAVRYGAWQPGPADEQEAIRCLEDVVTTLGTES